MRIGIDAAGGLLHGAIGEHARGAAFGVGVVVTIDDGAVSNRHGEQGYLPVRRASSAACNRAAARREVFRIAEISSARR